jgi:trehalose-6-phosphate hydrolase
MTNPKFDKIDDYRDVESLNMFEILKKDGLPEQEIIEILKQKSRDNSRTPVQWNASEHAGFTTGTPWIHTAANYKEINAENAMKDSDSVFYHYQELIHLRKEYDVITNGDYELVSEDHNSVFAFARKTEHEMLLVINNFYGKDIAYSLPVALDSQIMRTLHHSPRKFS